MSTPYHLSEHYNDLYLNGLKKFQSYLKEEDDYYVDFYPSLGHAPEVNKLEFLVYGQAVNGWPSGFNKVSRLNNAKLERSIEASNRRFVEANHSPIDWVNVRWNNNSYLSATKEPASRDFYPPGSYRCYRSFFWNTAVSVPKNGAN